jgi:hypothetical protein
MPMEFLYYFIKEGNSTNRLPNTARISLYRYSNEFHQKVGKRDGKTLSSRRAGSNRR